MAKFAVFFPCPVVEVFVIFFFRGGGDGRIPGCGSRSAISCLSLVRWPDPSGDNLDIGGDTLDICSDTLDVGPIAVNLVSDFIDETVMRCSIYVISSVRVVSA